MQIDRKVRILYVIGQLGVGGAERQLIYLASNLDKNRYEVLVCCFSAQTELLPLLEKAGIQTVILPQVMRPDMTRPFKLYQLVRSFNPDLIHSYLFVANTWSRIIGALVNIPVVLSERNSEPKKALYMRMIDRSLSRLGTCLIANSHAGARRVIQNNEFPSKKVFVVNNGVVLQNLQLLSEEEQCSLISKLGLAENNRLIGVIARLAVQKNHKLLFDAYKLLREQHTDLSLLCIGDGPLRGELQAYAKTLGIDNGVIFTGNRDDIPEILSVLDVLVLSSNWEGLPNVILEAMAARCPVVATNVGGVSEVITNGVTGWLTKPGDKYQLAEKIHFVLTHPEEVDRVKEHAFEFVAKNFSVRNMVSETEKIYEKVLAYEEG